MRTMRADAATATAMNTGTLDDHGDVIALQLVELNTESAIGSNPASERDETPFHHASVASS